MQKFNFNELSSESSNEVFQNQENSDNGVYVPDVDENINPQEAQQVLEVDQDIDIKNPDAPNPKNYANITPNLNAYNIYESYPTVLPCLTIDTIYTNKCQDNIYVLGSYTQQQAKNQIQLLKVSNLRSQQLDDDEPSDLEEYQQVQFNQRNIQVQDNILRIKSATHYANNQIEGDDNIIACMTDNDQLIVVNANQELNSLVKENQQTMQQQAQILKIDLPASGFGIDIQPEKQLIITGLQNSSIYCFKYTDKQLLQDKTNYCKIGGSVEDIRFNHIRRELFAACSTSGEVQITNTMISNSEQNTSTIKISNCDLNVLDWDYFDSNILYVGDDSGQIFVLDCKDFQNIKVVKQIHWQQSPITSIKANPNTSYQIAASDDNGGCVIYQMDAEEDDDLIQQGLFSEYLFLHCGLTEPKEVTWSIKEDVLAIIDLNGVSIIKGRIEEETEQ